jgi:hypothetical protein
MIELASFYLVGLAEQVHLNVGISAAILQPLLNGYAEDNNSEKDP